MKKQIHQEIFDFYSLNDIKGIKYNEDAKRAIRKTINLKFRSEHPNKNWSDLTEIEKADFKLITIKDYIFKKIMHPDGDRRGPSSSDARKKINELQAKIDEELKAVHRPLKHIEEHNKLMNILLKEFYDESASREENQAAYDEMCKYHSELFPKIDPPLFEVWERHPQRLFDMREEYITEVGKIELSKGPSPSRTIPKELILEEIINCILKELDIKIDVDGIVQCLEATRTMDYIDCELLDTAINGNDFMLTSSYLRLKEHDFIIKK